MVAVPINTNRLAKMHNIQQRILPYGLISVYIKDLGLLISDIHVYIIF